MIRGTTPTHTFNIPFEASDIEAARIIYAQNDKEIFTKTVADCSLNGNSISVKLTQEETFLFNCNYPVQIQLRVKLKDIDEIRATDIMLVPVGKCLEEEVLS